MSQVLTSIFVLFGLSVVLSLPAKRSPFPMVFSNFGGGSSGRLPGRLNEFDRNHDTALDRKELTKLFEVVFGNHKDHISQNVEEAMYVLDLNEDDFIDVNEAEPLRDLP